MDDAMTKTDILKAWNKEKAVIPIMIKRYCKGNHKCDNGALCDDCRALTEYALFRLEKCPFKENKQFCSFCKVHCYQPDMREKIKAVMKYSGPRLLFSHPIFALSHVVQMVKHKKTLKEQP